MKHDTSIWPISSFISSSIGTASAKLVDTTFDAKILEISGGFLLFLI